MFLSKENKNAVLFLLMFLFVLVLIRTAWITDDAMITLRTVLNFIHGYGARFNVDERVQAYTHPLWFLMLSGLSFITRNVFVTSFILSITTSITVFWLFISKVGKNYNYVLVAALALILSRAFIDFSTSGLENPLSHLLILLIFFTVNKLTINLYDNNLIRRYFFLASCLYLSRPDLIIIVIPLTAVLIYKSHLNTRSIFMDITIGAIPVILWTVFSLYYYGFPFSNTAYAKIATGISLNKKVIQGIKYFLHTIDRDTLTLAFTVLGVIVGLRSSSYIHKSLSLGSALYLVYIIIIGGDFMEGRFFTVPLFISSILVASSSFTNNQLAFCLIGILSLSLVGINSTILSNSTFSDKKIDSNGIANERGYYYQDFGLLNAVKKGFFSTFQTPKWKIENRSVEVTCGGLGYSSILKGPGCILLMIVHWQILYFVDCLQNTIRIGG